MRITIATTTAFHLQRLAMELQLLGEDIEFYSYAPLWRQTRGGLSRSRANSLFIPLAPTSILAQLRGYKGRMRAVESMLARTDEEVCKRIKESHVFVGLSSMAIKSARRAKELGAVVIIERSSRHVLSQNELLVQDGGEPLRPDYIRRELASYEAADLIVVPSQHAAESFFERGFSRDRLAVCQLGVDLHTFSPSPRPEGAWKLLFVGGWSFRKGVDLLQKAVESNPSWSLTHVGSIVDHPFPVGHPQITSVGHRTPKKLAQSMAEHHALVLPSREDGFGMVLLEALAAGLPIVATSKTGAPDIHAQIDQKQWVQVVEPASLESLTSGLRMMETVDNPAITNEPRQRLTATDKAYYSWAGYATRYHGLLVDAIASNGDD